MSFTSAPIVLVGPGTRFCMCFPRQAISQVNEFDALNPPEVKHPLIQKATDSIIRSAATIYEAQIYEATKLSGIQRPYLCVPLHIFLRSPGRGKCTK